MVDSIECDLRAVRWLLLDAGIETTYVGTASSARNIDEKFDALLTEAVLDDGSGIDLAGELIADGKVSRVVFYTEGTLPDALREARRLGPVLFKKDGPLGLVHALETAPKPKSAFPPPEEGHARYFEQIASGIKHAASGLRH
jgi:hypothetical protein